MKVLKELKRDKEDEAAVFEDLKEELLKEYPDHLPVLTAILASDASLPADKRDLQVMPVAAFCALSHLWQRLQHKSRFSGSFG